MDSNKKWDVIAFRMKKSHDQLHAAKALLQQHLPAESISASYYALFHAVRALLSLTDSAPKKHSGLISEFSRLFVKTEIFGNESARILTQAFQVRQHSDYLDFYVPSESEAEEQASNAELFVRQVDEHLQRLKNEGTIFEAK